MSMIPNANDLDDTPGIRQGFSLSRLNAYSLQNIDFFRDNFSRCNICCNYINAGQSVNFDNKSLTILNFNIRSMQTNFDRFNVEMLNYAYDIMGFCETRLTDDM